MPSPVPRSCPNSFSPHSKAIALPSLPTPLSNASASVCQHPRWCRHRISPCSPNLERLPLPTPQPKRRAFAAAHLYGKKNQALPAVEAAAHYTAHPAAQISSVCLPTPQPKSRAFAAAQPAAQTLSVATVRPAASRDTCGTEHLLHFLDLYLDNCLASIVPEQQHTPLYPRLNRRSICSPTPHPARACVPTLVHLENNAKPVPTLQPKRGCPRRSPPCSAIRGAAAQPAACVPVPKKPVPTREEQ